MQALRSENVRALFQTLLLEALLARERIYRSVELFYPAGSRPSGAGTWSDQARSRRSALKLCQRINVLEVILNRTSAYALLLASAFAFIVPLPVRASLPTPQDSAAGELHSAFEINGKLVGYGVDTLRPGRDGNPTVKRPHVVLQLTALGLPFDVEILGVEATINSIIEPWDSIKRSWMGKADPVTGGCRAAEECSNLK